jgi:hypothetical protein
MKIQKMNIMAKKNKNQNAELIERINTIQLELNEIKSDAGFVVEEADVVFTREQLENFLIEYTNKVNEFILGEAFANLESDEVVSFEVDGREINAQIDEDNLKNMVMNATYELPSDIMMEFADETLAEIGVTVN